MAALKDIARDVADVIREGIGWVIVYRAGRSWRSTTIFSDIGAEKWETKALDEALAVLKVDPDAVLLNGYYCGHFGEDMTVTEIAAGIRWHYERGYCRLIDKKAVYEEREHVERARAEAAACGLPFCDRPVDGAEDYFDPYVYDGSMTLEDYEAMRGGGTNERAQIRPGISDGAGAAPAGKAEGNEMGQMGHCDPGRGGVRAGADGESSGRVHMGGHIDRVHDVGDFMDMAGVRDKALVGLYP